MIEWPKRARTADWESGVLTLDGEKQFEVPELTAEIIERLAGYTLVGFHVKGYPVTDELLSPFSGHKSMVNFGVEDGALTDACFPVFSAMPKLRYLLLTGNGGIDGSGLSALRSCKLDLLALDHTGLDDAGPYHNSARCQPSPSSPISGLTTLLLLTMDCWPSLATTTSIRWPMSNSRGSRWTASPSSNGKRPKSPSSWTSRRRRNAAKFCPPSLQR